MKKKAVVTKKVSYTEVFGQWLCDMASVDQSLLAITPAMREGSGMVEFQQKFPKRYFDVGIAEQHSVTLAAGMACEGAHPVVAIYSTFLQRAYDQLIHDVALQNLPVLFAIDRAGLVGPDGPTHAGSFDLSYLRCIPNMLIMAPADENECRRMLSTGFRHDGPAAVRYPRGSGPGVAVEKDFSVLKIGQSKMLRKGRKTAILAFGSMVETCRPIAEKLDATLINMRFVKPLDEQAILDAAHHHLYLITVEENARSGGAGSGVSECLNKAGMSIPVLNIGLEDGFIEHGSREECLHFAGLDVDGVYTQAQSFLKLQESGAAVSTVKVGS